MGARLATFLVFVGCCSNLIFLEVLMKDDPGGGHLITFLQFLFIALDGLIFTSRFGTKSPKIPINNYLILVVLFFVANICNNYAFNFNIPMPLHMIFRAGSLVANMIMGIIILKKSYTMDKYISVTMITLGIIICTLLSVQDVKSTVPITEDSEPTTPWDDFFWWIIGIILLTISLFISARLGIYQQILYSHYGKHPREALYYTHLLPLPFFLFLSRNLFDHMIKAVNSPLVTIPCLKITMPKTIAYLIGNMLSQYICINSVYTLTSECTSLTVTLILTLRKFTSLIFSILYFRNPFTTYHWIGTTLVFIGTLIFSEFIPKLQRSVKSMFEEKKKVKSK